LLAARAVELVERGQSGIFHVGGGAPVSWYQFARTIFDVAKREPMLLATNEREYRAVARRPKYSALSNGKMERAGLAPMPTLREVLERYFAERSRRVSGSPV
jgi:dTDP-4-dehydrorhamnose reductase